MSRYNRFFESGFAGCRLLARTRDHCRDRNVQVFALPGEFEVVGVHDGVDAWVAPVIAEPFAVNVRSLLDKIRHGEDPRVVDTTAPTPQAGQKRPRARLSLDPAPQPTPAPQPVPQGARRERARL